MLLRNRPEIVWAEGDGRTPRGMSNVKTELYCQHYGKSLSVGHSEGTYKLLYPPLPLRHLRQEMDGAQRSGDPHQVRFQATALCMGRDAVHQCRADVRRPAKSSARNCVNYRTVFSQAPLSLQGGGASYP